MTGDDNRDDRTDRKIGGLTDVGERTVLPKYRVSIPAATLGHDVGDEIDVAFRTDDWTFEENGLPVNAGGRVTIPYHRRLKYGVDVGDEVRVAASTAPGGGHSE